MRTAIGVLAAAVGLQACANHMIEVPRPVTASESFAPVQQSSATLWGAAVKPLKADKCEVSNAMSAVRIDTSLGQALLTVLTLGFWQPVRITYLCAPIPDPDVPPPPPDGQ
jgi:hypothetical protein